MPPKKQQPVLTYYRFQHEAPTVGEIVHCFVRFETFRDFVRMMRADDPDARRMKTWEVSGEFVREDDGDAEVRVVSSREIPV